ncbi:MAG: HesA/MoeB/ThiF family protein [Thermoplasmata archaeon]|nr:HesA/MoeB/ThiF family protein [Thermoplasmata archaeon]
MALLSKPQLERYDRNLKLKNYSKGDQERLLRSKVLVIGTGGLGSPILLYLAANGVGNISVVDSDSIELSNLQRQVIHDSESIGKQKAKVAKARMEKLNPDVNVRAVDGRFNKSNARKIVANHDMIVDASDNFATKFLVNDASVLEKKPFSIGSVLEYHGQVSTFIPGKSPCYRCLFKQPPDGAIPTTAEVGVLGTVPGIIGIIQATEVIKVLLGKGTPLLGRLLLMDVLDWDFQIIKFERAKNCPACGDRPVIKLKK